MTDEKEAPQPITDIELKLYEMWVTTYRHHTDLTIKGLTVYLAIIGAVGGYIFGSTTTSRTRLALLTFLLLVSVITFGSLRMGLIWFRGFSEIVEKFSRKAPMAALPLTPIRRFGNLLSALIIIIFFGVIVLIIWEIFYGPLVTP